VWTICTHVRAGFIVRIRADPDELAYKLHIIFLRFGPERALTAVELTVADIRCSKRSYEPAITDSPPG
jgi:Zn-dependent M32 family carboxypeptidase